MNLDWNEGMALLSELHRMEKAAEWKADVALFPPFIFLRHFHEFLSNAGSAMRVGAQDCSAHAPGAYTGEVSASMIRSTGASLCIIGHSERREYHREDSEMLSRKVERALEAGLTPVFCCGERLEDRQNGNETFVIDGQLDGTIFELPESLFSQLVIAYEPVWAIGTGKTATPAQAQDMHAFIRGLVQSKYGKLVAESLRILYGGSVKPENAWEIFSQPDVDGGLIGGASLKAEQFRLLIDAGS